MISITELSNRACVSEEEADKFLSMLQVYIEYVENENEESRLKHARWLSQPTHLRGKQPE